MVGKLKTKKPKIKRSDVLFDTVTVIILVFLLIITAYPIWFVLIASISDPVKVNIGEVVLWPKGITFEGYAKVLQYNKLWIGYRNTIIYCIVHMAMAVSVRMMAGYAMSRKDLVGRGAITVFFVITMYFGGGLIPTYLILHSMHLTGQPFVVLLFGVANVGNIIVCRTFIQSSIPEELYEAAVMDGCSHTNYFLRVVLPLSKAILVIFVLFSVVSQWNSWYGHMIYLNEESQMPLQMFLRDILVKQTGLSEFLESGGNETEMLNQAMLAESMKYAIIVVSTMPIMCVYPFLQKYFVKGMMVGSVKG